MYVVTSIDIPGPETDTVALLWIKIQTQTQHFIVIRMAILGIIAKGAINIEVVIRSS